MPASPYFPALFAVLALSCPLAIRGESPARKAFPPEAYAQRIAPLLEQFCSDCHGPEEPEAGLSFARYKSVKDVREGRKTWGKIQKMLDLGAMPPSDQPQPTPEQKQLLLEWIEAELFYVDCSQGVDPGRVTIRRLNRNEYDNTIRDLLGLDLKLSQKVGFPSDDVGEGFDNIGDVLSLSPLLFEKYIQAAEEAIETAVVDPAKLIRTVRKSGRDLRALGSFRAYRGGYMFPSNGAVFQTFEFPHDGDYLLRVQAGAQQAGGELAKMEVNLKGRRVKVIEVKAELSEPQVYEVRVSAKAGWQRVSAAFINDFYDPKNRDPKNRDRNLWMGHIEVHGPLTSLEDKLTDSHRRLVTTTPQREGSAEKAARKILQNFARRTYRRPVDEADLAPLLELFRIAQKRQESFERSLQVAFVAALSSPHFLFRVEQDREPENPAAKRKLNDYELASRLSYFLWSSMPDARLFELAAKDRLHQPETLRQEVRRMLQDPKSQAVVENFGGQWLNLRELEERNPDPAKFPQFSKQLRADMRRETELLFAEILRQDRSILDFVNADFSFVNRRLAEHYGLSQKPKDDAFQRVSWKGSSRRGLLSHASILTLTSYPDRTSPVQRGKWIMENFLGAPPPEPPAGVSELSATQKAAPDASLRKQLEIHRKDPNCSVCHLQMDALGFGLENFDAVGRWREKDDRKNAIDASGKLPSGEQFAGPAELAEILGKRKRAFGRTLSKKMLTYAIGRGLQYYDRCAVDKILDHLEKHDFRFSALVEGVVQSDPFLLRRGDGGSP